MSTSPRCALVCVGSELLRGKINTHASTVARLLASIGLALHEETTVSDELPELIDAIRHALRRHEVVLVTGGLGPTFDDLTREAASEACGRPLIFSEVLQRGIVQKFRRAHYRMPPENICQAYLLDGAKAIPNRNGTAPGQWLALRPVASPKSKVSRLGTLDFGRVLILLPGPPRELHPMLERSVIPRLRKTFPAPPQVEAHLHFVGVPESIVDHKIRPIIDRVSKKSSVQFTILAHLGLVDLDIFVTARSGVLARRTLQGIVGSIKRLLGDAFYGMNEDYPLERVVGGQLRRKRQTLAVAESCTGGLLASRLTEIAGSSDYFLSGFVTYSNAAKARDLGVSLDSLRRHGAVSRPVAVQMAQGVRQRTGATWGLGITGIAGPGGGTSKKPLGLVYVALASSKKTWCVECRFKGDRDAIRQRAVLAALDLLRRENAL